MSHVLGPMHMLVVLLVALVAEARRWSAKFESELRGALDLTAEPAPTGDVTRNAVGATESERSNPGADPSPVAQTATRQTEERA